jgi:hypothetical protein
MKNIGGFSRLSNQQPSLAMIQRFAGCIGVAILLMMTGIAAAQNPTPTNPLPAPEAQMSAPTGYSVHSSVDVGGRMAGIDGSGAMYDTLVNMQSGPRVLGETFEMRALPGNKSTFVDTLTAFSTGFGGDPNSFSKLALSKGRIYDFSGIFRRDRQYFDYDLLGNPNIPSGESVPVTGSTTPFARPQVNQSPFMFNTVRRMTDTHLTLLPLSKITFRAGYSQNIFQGPSLSPSGYQVASSYDILLEEMQRNSTDDFTGGIDWKPVRGTKLTFEEEIDHYKQDSYFVMDPSYFNVQEADGTPVALLANYDSLTPYASSACNANSMGGTPMLSPATTPGGPPIVNAACAVLSSYQRTAPTRILYPTEIFRLQSNSLKNVSMNGDVRYTKANMNLPNYYDSFEGLSKTTRSLVYTANASAKREVMAADYGIVWQATKTFAFEDQFTFSNVQQPGTATMTSLTTVATAATPNSETINNPTLTTTVVNAPTTPATGTFEGSGSIGTPSPDFFGQKRVNNDFTLTWDATPRTMLSLTYRYGTHIIAEGLPQNAPLAVNATNDGTVTINETGGIFSAALRPTENWTINGSVEMLYNDNAFTPMTPRQTKQYRVHTMFRPKPWATVSGSFNDLEHHNNTNNDQLAVSPVTGPSLVAYAGPLDHVDYSRVLGLGAELFPNDRYGIDFNYAYSDVYMGDNICYLGGASAALPVAASTPSGTSCPATSAGRSGYDFGPALDFMHAPTQSGSVAFSVSPVKSIKSNIGYNINSVNGTRFYNDPRDVAGSLVSTYESPFVNFAWTSRPGLIWKAEYNFYGYGEGGQSGAALCSTTNPTPSTPVTPEACSTLPNQTGMNISSAGETAPRNFHANNVTLGLHYEF